MSFSEDQIPFLLEAITSSGKALAQHEQGAREKLLSLSYALSTALETPSETIQRMGWTEPSRFTATRLAIDLKLFEKLSETSDGNLSSAQLARMSGADETLISRTMKHLCATNIVAETGSDTYASTRISNAFTLPKYRDGIKYCYDIAGPSFQTIPSYLRKISYHNPHDVSNGPFQHAHNTNLSIFEYLSAHPPYSEIFNNYMSGYRDGRSSWMDPGIYPVTERLGQQTPNDDPYEFNTKRPILLVDVGGGMGQDLKEFRSKHPDIPGRLILQDMASVIAQIPADDYDDHIGSYCGCGRDGCEGGNRQVFEAMAHDFFTPQPVLGARAYHLHSILHNWDDASCLKILRALLPALSHHRPNPKPKLLVFDFVIPDQGAAWPATSMDWFMMAVCNVCERTEAQWRKLLGEAGLKVEGIWNCGVGEESLIEAVVEDGE